MHKKKLKFLSLTILTLQSANLALSMRYARTRPGDKFYNSTVVLMPEFIKLSICLLLVYREEHKNFRQFIKLLKKTILINYLDTLKVCFPSLLFNIQNNLLYVAATHLDAVTHQVTYQLKILTTALFAVIILNRKILKTQWLALVLLVFGIVLVQMPQIEINDNAAMSTPTQNSMLGLLAAISAGILSGFAGIYFEKMLKGSDISVWLRNVQLSLLSIPFGILTCFAKDAQNISLNGFFFGYDYFIWFLILQQALGGLLVAVVVKYADNILKSFATSLSIIISCIFSIYIFDFNLTLCFSLGTAIVITSVFLYGYVPNDRNIKRHYHKV